MIHYRIFMRTDGHLMVSPSTNTITICAGGHIIFFQRHFSPLFRQYSTECCTSQNTAVAACPDDDGRG